MVLVGLDPIKKPKKFRPFKKPRYLIGQVKTSVWKTDLDMFNKHRHEVFHVKSRVDHYPFPMNPRNFLNTKRMVDDMNRLREIDKGNKNIIQKLNQINRQGGIIDTFNPRAYERASKWRNHELDMLALDKLNVDFYRKITRAQSEYPTSELDEFWKEMCHKLSYTCKFPLLLLSNKSLDRQLREAPSISNGLNQGVVRPMCYMDFKVKKGVFLGRIVIELYEDYVPVTVQNFMSLCCNEDGLSYKNCCVHKAVPGDCIELGDITKGNGKGGISIYGETFAEENHELKHTKMGVLSTIRVKSDKLKLNNSQFCITLAAREKFNGNRVVFGRVIVGNSTLCRISDLGRKCGSPVAPVCIHDCGKFIKGKTPAVIRNFKYV